MLQDQLSRSDLVLFSTKLFRTTLEDQILHTLRPLSNHNYSYWQFSASTGFPITYVTGRVLQPDSI
jgi:hypothetical protein